MPHDAAVLLEAWKVWEAEEPQEGSHSCQEAAWWKLVVPLEALQMQTPEVPQVLVLGLQLVDKQPDMLGNAPPGQLWSQDLWEQLWKHLVDVGHSKRLSSRASASA